jgi:hypothetical protein
MAGYAPLGAADLLGRIWAALTHRTVAGHQQKGPVRFPARAQFVSFIFVNNLICGIVSSNHDAGRIWLNVIAGLVPAISMR